MKFTNRFLMEPLHPAVSTRLAALSDLEYEIFRKKSKNSRPFPFFSIIVLIHDTAISFVQACLSSLEAQTCESFEVILIDNGSSGEVRSLIEDFYSKQPRCMLLRTQTNLFDPCKPEIESPTALLWNAALFIANGEVSYFLSCDDLFSANALEEIKTVFEATRGVATVAPRVHSIDANGNLNSDISAKLDLKNGRSDYIDGLDLTRSFLREKPLIGAPGGLLFAKIEHIIARGGYDAVNDLTQWLKFAPYGLHGYAHKATLYWRHHAEQENKKLARAGFCHYLTYQQLNLNYNFSEFFNQIGLKEEAKTVESFLLRIASKVALASIRNSANYGGIFSAFQTTINAIKESHGKIILGVNGIYIVKNIIYAFKVALLNYLVRIKKYFCD